MSKGFKVINGDVVVNQTIEMLDGSNLLRQTVELVIGTNKREWKYDVEEGIERALILRKNPVEDEIRATIEEALIRIDDTFTIISFNIEMVGRHANIKFEAVNSKGEEVGGAYTYAY